MTDGEYISVRVIEFQDKTLTVMLRKDALVDELFDRTFEKLKDRLDDRAKAKDLKLYYLIKQLEYGKNKRLHDYKINYDKATVHLVLGLPGGLWPLVAVKRAARGELQPLPGFITLTKAKNEPDVISLEDSTDELRAKMPCGHVIGPASMTSYCHSLLSEGKYEFLCPGKGCDQVWEYFMVSHVACLTDAEKAEFEKKITENYLARAGGFQQCPGCSTWCYRTDRNNIRVHCTFCSKRLKSTYDFCWACHGQWKTSGTKVCGNRDCDGKDPRQRILSSAPTKEINGISGCPSIRACPSCGLLIYHREGCRRMTCSNCETKFCFICLKLGECSLFSKKCEVSPIQNLADDGAKQATAEQASCIVL